MAKFPPNKYQQAIIDASKTGKDGIVQAGAGTGKTATFRMIAEANPDKKILYMAFNRSVADQAEHDWQLPHVLCRNPHRLAYKPFARQAQRRGGKYPKARDIASALHIQGFDYRNGDDEDTHVDSIQIAVAVTRAISRFCTSDDTEIGRYHVAGTDLVRNMPDEHREEFIAHVLPYAQSAWSDIADPNGTLPFMPGRGDGCYLKLWSLSDPQLYFDIILYDEAQDANPAVAHVVEIQRNCQKIYVGDSAQAIYQWNGAVDALKKFKADWNLELPQSYRFGAAIAQEANRWLPYTESKLTIIGHEAIDSKVEPLDWTTVERNGDAAYPTAAILCRTNAGCIESAMNAQESGKRVAIAGGTKDIESFIKAASMLMDGRRVTHPELAGYPSWSAVQEAVKKGEADDIGMMVRLVDNYGVMAIQAVCDASTKPEQADIMVSTAHKAKGLEWDSVKIHGDFTPPKDETKKLSVTECMLIYVAITRAKKHLDNGALAWLAQFEQDVNESMDQIEEEN